LKALGFDACLIAAHVVAPYRVQGRGGKNDANNAAAVCEARVASDHAIRAGQNGPSEDDRLF
jgi:hypothetical protein